MQKNLWPRFRLLLLAFSGLLAQTPNCAPAKSSAKPALAVADNVVTDYFGTKVADPYRWMEAGPQDPRVTGFLTTQSEITRSVLTPLSAPRTRLLARIRELDNAIPTVRS